MSYTIKDYEQPRYHLICHTGEAKSKNPSVRTEVFFVSLYFLIEFRSKRSFHLDIFCWVHLQGNWDRQENNVCFRCIFRQKLLFNTVLEFLYYSSLFLFFSVTLSHATPSSLFIG